MQYPASHNRLLPCQIRAARALLGWSARELAEAAGLALRTIQYMEAEDDPGQARKSSLIAVRAVLEAAGIEFIGAPEDGPGVRLYRPGP